MYRTWQNNRDQHDPPTKNNQKEGKVFMRQMILRILDIKQQRTVILRQETNKVSVTAPHYWKPWGFPGCDTGSRHGRNRVKEMELSMWGIKTWRVLRMKKDLQRRWKVPLEESAEYWLADLCVETIGSQGKKEPSEKTSGISVWCLQQARNSTCT